ncbi:MAG TPA: prephenate dehydrogenase/arogenate dehydrogenase family protein, partial [Nitrososphaerales archaeon]|nr:prephenate dehydrogenase/arogenate dehydrogenase family protein [Nitrososphaerales archaeon]
MRVAVLGAAGGMGSFFARYFRRQGQDVAVFDVRRPAKFPAGTSVAKSNSDAVRGADVVLVAVPMGATAAVVREVSPDLERGSIVIEMTSVKGDALAELRSICESGGVNLLSIHPMFGPLSKEKNFKMCVVGGRKDEAAARLIFPGARMILLGSKEHDRLMAYALSLVHLLNLAFASAVVRSMGLDQFKNIATPLASAQLNLSQAVLSQDPDLFSRIQTENPFVVEVLSSFISQLEGFQRSAEMKDTSKFEEAFAATASTFSRTALDEALRRIYTALP